MQHKEIAVFFTGGTIGMGPCDGAPGVAPGGNFERLMTDLAPDPHPGAPDAPGSGQTPPIRLRPIAWSDKPSPHMTPACMFQLARDLDAALAEPDTAGAVVLHGTDVLAETAFLCDLVLASRKPVVFTGSMRYYTEIGYDGLRNLVNGVRACLKPLPPETGVVLLMNDRFFAAREVVKINSLNVDAFGAGEAGVLGYVAGRDVALSPLTALGKRVRLRPDHLETHVPLVTCYTGMDGAAIDALRAAGMAGLVVEGFGAGNVPPAALPAIDACLAQGVVVVLATRCIEGGVWPIYGYEGGGADLARRGVILSGRLGGPKARLQLMAALGAGLDAPAIRNLFEEDHA
ncbi:MAG: asparaginase [Desulfovibrionaceae bacterium]